MSLLVLLLWSGTALGQGGDDASAPQARALLLREDWPAALEQGVRFKVGDELLYSSGSAHQKVDGVFSKLFDRPEMDSAQALLEALKGDEIRRFWATAALSQYYQNTWYPDDAARHVLSCAVDDALALLAQDIQAVDLAWSQAQDLDAAAEATGRAMHTVMDFHGLTDWIDRQLVPPTTLAIWTESGRSQARGLHSHFRATAQPSRCGTARPDLDKTRRTKHSETVHAITGRTLFQEAELLAPQAALEFTRWLLTERVPGLGARLDHRMVYFPGVARSHGVDAGGGG